MLGPAAGRHLHALAHNRDPRPVQVGRRRRLDRLAAGPGPRARATPDEVDAILAGLVDRVTRRMRAADRLGRTVVLRLRFADFSRATRSHTLPRPTAHTQTILGAARALLAEARPLIAEQGLTLVGIAVGNLDNGDACSWSCRFDAHSGGELTPAMDAVGTGSAPPPYPGAPLLGQDPGLTVPMLPTDPIVRTRIDHGSNCA